jgi:hypothetical protein
MALSTGGRAARATHHLGLDKTLAQRPVAAWKRRVSSYLRACEKMIVSVFCWRFAFSALTGTPANEEDWTLEALGNWKGFREDDEATLDWDVLDQSRLRNKVNDIDNDDNHANAPSGSISGAGSSQPAAG